MGLFGFGKPAIDKQLIELFARNLEPRVGSQARAMAKQWVQMARKKSESEGTLDLDYDTYMQLAEGEEESKLLAAKREDGVTDEDLQLWWGFHDMERRITAIDAAHTQLAFYIAKMEDGLSRQKAAEEMRKYNPIYGDPRDTKKTTGDDRPLPHELRDRVNGWMEIQFTEPDTFRTLLAESSTFNALIRCKIRAEEI